VVHPPRGGHEYSAATIPTDKLQTMDAHRPCALVDRADIGSGNLCPLVCPGSVSEINSSCDLPHFRTGLLSELLHCRSCSSLTDGLRISSSALFAHSSPRTSHPRSRAA